MPLPRSELEDFYSMGLSSLQMLEVPEGIMASSKEEIYGCIFGRDSLITTLKLLRAYRYRHNPYFLTLSRKVLLGIMRLQGSVTNLESGEEPGKCIHEFRIAGHEHLTQAIVSPWYLYPDGTMRNFDSVDATPLLLIAIYRYYQKSQDQEFLLEAMPHVEMALDWIFHYGDKYNEGLISYQMPAERKSGGLISQGWMDSSEAVFHEDETPIVFPMAPIEVQSYAYLALKLWGNFFREPEKKKKYKDKAAQIKSAFREKFIIRGLPKTVIAHAVDGSKKPLTSLRSSLGHVLWACRNPIDDGMTDSILEKPYRDAIVRSLLSPSIFEASAGIRTLSKTSRAFSVNSYHNGSLWPHDNSLIAEGMENLGYFDQAATVREGIFQAYKHFRTPLELFVYDEGIYNEYSANGQVGCRTQAWSAATMVSEALALMHYEDKQHKEEAVQEAL